MSESPPKHDQPQTSPHRRERGKPPPRRGKGPPGRRTPHMREGAGEPGAATGGPAAPLAEAAATSGIAGKIGLGIVCGLFGALAIGIMIGVGRGIAQYVAKESPEVVAPPDGDDGQPDDEPDGGVPAADDEPSDEPISDDPAAENPTAEDPAPDDPAGDNSRNDDPFAPNPPIEEPEPDEPRNDDPFADIPLDDPNPPEEEDPPYMEPKIEEPEPPEPATVDALADIRNRECLLLLPPVDDGEPRELAKVLVDSPADCELQLVGADAAFGGAWTAEVVPEEPAAETDPRRWQVQLASRAAPRPLSVGEFILHEQSLSYQWRKRLPPSLPAAHLRWCVLDVRANDEHEQCVLGKPELVPQAKINIFSAAGTVKLPPILAELITMEQLRFDVEFDCDVAGVRNPVIDDGAGLRPDEKCSICLTSDLADEDPEDRLVEIEVDVCEKGRCQLGYRAFMFPVERSNDGTTKTERKPVKQKWLTDTKRRLEGYRKTRGFEATKLRTQVEQIEKTIEALKRQITGVTRKSPSQVQVEQQINMYQQELSIKKRGLQNIEEILELSQSGTRWCELVEKVQENLSERPCLGYRAYIDIDGKEVEIVRTDATLPVEVEE